MRHTITVDISPGGETKTTVQGIKGKGCEVLLKWLEKLGKTTGGGRTDEYFEKEAEKTCGN
jgi:hypothetical protein